MTYFLCDDLVILNEHEMISLLYMVNFLDDVLVRLNQHDMIFLLEGSHSCSYVSLKQMNDDHVIFLNLAF